MRALALSLLIVPCLLGVCASDEEGDLLGPDLLNVDGNADAKFHQPNVKKR